MSQFKNFCSYCNVAGDLHIPLQDPVVLVGMTLAFFFMLWLFAFGSRGAPEVLLAWLCIAVLVTFIFHVVNQPYRTGIALVLLAAPPALKILTREKQKRNFLASIVGAGCIMWVSIFVANIQPDQVIDVLGWGYDSYAHLGMFSAFVQNGTYFFVNDQLNDTIFSWAPSYPSGHWALWNLFAVASGSSTRLWNSHETIRVYSFFVAVTSFALVALVSIAVARLSRARKAQTPLVSLTVTAALGTMFVVVVGNFSHMFWSGFPSLVLGAAVVVAQLGASYGGSPFPRWLVASAGLLATAFVYPLFVPLSAAIALGALAEILPRGGFVRYVASVSTTWATLSLGAVTGVVLYAGFSAYRRFNIFAGGGIEPVSIQMLTVLAASTFWLLFFSVKRRDYVFGVGLFVQASASATLAYQSTKFEGYITYYPMRMIYLLQLLVIIGLAVQAIVVQGLWRRSVILGCIIALLVVTLHNARHPQVFSGPAMGSSVAAFNALKSGQTAASWVCGTQVLVAARSIQDRPGTLALVVPDAGGADLSSRWPNSLVGRMNNETLLLTTGVDTIQGPNRISQAVERWRRATGREDAVVVVFSPDIALQIETADFARLHVETIQSTCFDVSLARP